jgi:hypothetical protein
LSLWFDQENRVIRIVLFQSLASGR